MLSLNFYGIAIRNKKGDIISLARENYKGELFFVPIGTDEDCGKLQVSLHDGEKKALRSFTAKASKGSYYISENLKEILEEEYKLSFVKTIWNDYYRTDYSQIKGLVSIVGLRVDYNENI